MYTITSWTLKGKTATTLMLATQMASLTIVQALLDAGVNVDAINSEGVTALSYIQSATITSGTSDALHPWFKEYEKVHLEISKALLRHGATVDTKSHILMTPLSQRALKWHIESFSLLLGSWR